MSYRGSPEKHSGVFKACPELSKECSSSPVLRLLEGKAAAAWTSGAYGGVREHGQGARTPLAAFFNIPYQKSTETTNTT